MQVRAIDAGVARGLPRRCRRCARAARSRTRARTRRSPGGARPRTAASASTVVAGCGARGAFGSRRSPNTDALLEVVAQLAHVARPARGGERGDELRRGQLARSSPAIAPIRREQVLDEQRHVAGALAQRRQRELDDREPVVEVGAERAAVDLGAQIAVGRRDDAQVARASSRGRRRAGSRATRARAAASAGARAAARRSRRGTACRRTPARTRRCAGRSRR